MRTGEQLHEEELRELLELVPTDRFETAVELWHRLGKWAKVSVRHWLVELSRRGVVERRLPVTGNAPRAEYRRITTAEGGITEADMRPLTDEAA